MTRGRLLLGASLLCAPLACGSSDSGSTAAAQGGSAGTTGAGAIGGCNVAYDCATGETCAAQSSLTFGCVPSGPALEGETCDIYASSAPCADRLTCLFTSDAPTGTCVQWCSDTLACDSGKACSTFGSMSGLELRLCL